MDNSALLQLVWQWGTRLLVAPDLPVWSWGKWFLSIKYDHSNIFFMLVQSTLEKFAFCHRTVTAKETSSQIRIRALIYQSVCLTTMETISHIREGEGTEIEQLYQWNSYPSWYPLHKHGLIPALTSNYIQYTVWDETTYPFSNFNDATVALRERVSNFILHFSGHVITYPIWD